MTYGFDISDIIPQTTGATNYFQYLSFESVAGPSSLKGIRTSRVVPSYQYNSKNHPLNPTRGRSLYISTEFAGSILGGNVNTIRPSVDFQYYHLAPRYLGGHHNVFAMHTLTSFITGYGGKGGSAILARVHRR